MRNANARLRIGDLGPISCRRICGRHKQQKSDLYNSTRYEPGTLGSSPALEDVDDKDLHPGTRLSLKSSTFTAFTKACLNVEIDRPPLVGYGWDCKQEAH